MAFHGLITLFIFGAVVLGHARVLVVPWAMGVDSGWAKLFLALGDLGDALPSVARSVPVALALWSTLLAWRLGRDLSVAGRWCVGVGLLVWVGPGLGTASEGASTYLRRVFGAFDAEYGRTLAVPVAMAERPGLERAFTIAGAALALGFLCAALGIAFGRRGRDAGSPAPNPWLEWLHTSLAVLVAGAGVAALLHVAVPMARENAHPIDVRFAYVNCSLCFPPALALEGVGPHPVRDAPLAEVGSRGDRVDGVSVSGEALFDVLKNKRELWKQINPGRDFPGVILLNPARLERVADLESRLVTVYRAGYPAVDVLFTERHFEVRPLFGEVWGRSDTALRLRVARRPSDCGVAPRHLLELGPHAEEAAGAFLRELAARHRDGSVPCVLLPPWAPDEPP